LSRVLRWVERHRKITAMLLCAELAATLFVAMSGGGADAGTIPLPVNDLSNLLKLTGLPTPAPAPLQSNTGPPVVSVPPAVCDPGSRPLVGEQGRVPASAIDSPAAAQGWTCNLSEVGHYPTAGGFRVWRYVDTQGHQCAFYDTSLFSPGNVVSLLAGPSPGVVVLDMSDPAHPVKTDMLTSLPMALPHESLNLNAKRGLLAAEMGNGATLPGLMAIYDVSQDCLHPTLDSTYLAAPFGHESGFAADGNTFYIGGGEGIAAVDVSDPKHPHTIWEGNEFAHGLNVSDDGDRLYDSDPITGALIILNVSQIQNRVPHPQVTEVSRLTWGTVSVPQNTDPMEIDGKPYLLEFDEFGFRFGALPPGDTVGAARIIDISDETHPKVVSDLRLAVNQPAAHRAADGDPSALPLPQTTYAAHYCAIPREVDPEIAACSFINSGLRIFNIQDPSHPREVAYYISPPHVPGGVGNLGASDFAMSQPAFDPATREVWYTDATSGFYSLKLDPAVWPDPTSVPSSAPACPAATGKLAGTVLGPVALGAKRATVRHALPKFSTRNRHRMDFFCVAKGRIRVGYAHGRAVFALTANRRYSLDGIHTRTKLGKVSRRLHLQRGFPVGKNTWYVVHGARANGILKVQNGVIRELGIASKALTSGSRKHVRRFFTSFS
jgi:hypothetical protein